MNRLRHRAFTLVELLVVAAIMAMFFSMVAAGSRPNPASQIRQAVQSITSALAATQAGGLGSASGAAVILESGTVRGLPAAMCVTLLSSDVAPAITGIAPTTSLAFPLSGSQLTLLLVPLNADPADLVHGYKVRFGGFSVADPTSGTIPYQPPSPWFAIAASPPDTTSTNSVRATVAFRGSIGQTATNTIWPEPIANGTTTYPFTFRVSQYPVPQEPAASLPSGVAIDLRYSGVGEDVTTVWGSLAAKGAIGLGFDSVGGFDEIMQKVVVGPGEQRFVQPMQPVEPIYLLVTTRDDIQDNPLPLSNPRAMWVAIHPKTGRVTAATNVPQNGVSATDLRAARAKARSAILGDK
jgi:prepilin-type N-terminal cleavage/methylation domain-containing protein